MRNRVLGLLSCGLFLSVGQVQAEPYLFGFSSGVGSQQLVLNGGALVFDTSASRFLAGSDNQGWWSDTVPNYDSNDNYIVGSIGATLYNNFFTFDLSSLNVPVTSAYLSLPRATTSGTLPVTYSLFDVSTNPVTLNSNVGSNAGIFNDLGSGILYGSVVVSNSLTPDPLLINLNANAIAALNAHRDFFSIGGTLDPGQQPVPEPASMLLLGAGLTGLAVRRRRKS